MSSAVNMPNAARAVASVLTYIQKTGVLPSKLKTPIDVINFICHVVEDINKNAKSKDQIDGAGKKELAIHILGDVLPELQARGLISESLCAQVKELLSNEVVVSAFIDSIISIWNELTKNKCALFRCCCCSIKK
jgi:hypothetical protein